MNERINECKDIHEQCLLQALARTGRLGVVSWITTIYSSVFPHFMFALPFNLISPPISSPFGVRVAAVRSVGARNNLPNGKGICFIDCAAEKIVLNFYSQLMAIRGVNPFEILDRI